MPTSSRARQRPRLAQAASPVVNTMAPMLSLVALCDLLDAMEEELARAGGLVTLFAAELRHKLEGILNTGGV